MCSSPKYKSICKKKKQNQWDDTCLKTATVEMSFAALLRRQMQDLANTVLTSQNCNEDGETLSHEVNIILSNAEFAHGFVPNLIDMLCDPSSASSANKLSALEYTNTLSKNFQLTVSTVTRLHEKLRYGREDEGRLCFHKNQRKLCLQQERFKTITAETERACLEWIDLKPSKDSFANLLGIASVFYAHFTYLAPFQEGNELTALFVVFSILARLVAVPFRFEHVYQWNIMQSPLLLCTSMLTCIRRASIIGTYLNLE